MDATNLRTWVALALALLGFLFHQYEQRHPEARWAAWVAFALALVAVWVMITR